MNYNSQEVSREAGQPIRCYEFARGPLRFSYTGTDRDVTLGNRVFKTTNISDSGIQFTGQSAADPITINLPADTEISNMYRGVAPSDEVTLTVWDWHYGADDFIVSFVGSVLNCKWPTAYTCEIVAWSLTASLDKLGLRLCWQRGCPHSLYDKNCRANDQDFVVPGNVQVINGIVARVPATGQYPDGWFSGGYVEWESSPGIMERRGIRTHVGGDLTILGGVSGLLTGQIIKSYPGCVRTTSVCDTKFHNLDNYGGAPALPGRSPFDGNPVF